MGQHESVGRASDDAAAASVRLDDVSGFQVVRVLRGSPAHVAGMVPYFDLITGLDHVALSSEEMSVFAFFHEYMREHAGKIVCFTMYNLYTRTYRDVECTLGTLSTAAEVAVQPATQASSSSSSSSSQRPPRRVLLGCSVTWSRASTCVQQGLHIVDVLAGSPAAHCADIQAERDYILGMQLPEEQYVTLLKSEQDMYTRLDMWHSLQRSAQHFCDDYPDEGTAVPHTLLLLLYDRDARAVKEVEVDMGPQLGTPLGVHVAVGLLHRVPCAQDERARRRRDGDGDGVDDPPVMTQFASCSQVAATVESVPTQTSDCNDGEGDDKTATQQASNETAVAASTTADAALLHDECRTSSDGEARRHTHDTAVAATTTATATATRDVCVGRSCHTTAPSPPLLPPLPVPPFVLPHV